MTLKEIELQRYVNTARLSCIRAAYKRVEPFSEEFERLLREDLRIQEEQRRLLTERTDALTELNGLSKKSSLDD